MMNKVHSQSSGNRQRKAGSRGAFTIVELLLVITVIVILVGVSIPSFDARMSGRKLDSAAEQVVASLNEARTLAIAQSRETEIRFYRSDVFGDENSSGDGDLPVRELTIYLRENGSFEEIGEKTRLPDPIIVNENLEYSPVLANETEAEFSEDEDGDSQTPRKFYAIRFRPDGSVNLGGSGNSTESSWLGLTLQESFLIEDRTELPDNYITIQILPDSGSIRRFQPR